MPQTLGTRAWKAMDYVCARLRALPSYDPFFNKYNPNPSFHSEMVRQTAAEVVGEIEAHTRLPTADRLIVPGLRQRCARGDLRGEERLRDLMHEKVGEIKAQIIERDGEVWMVKECPIHGKYET